MYEMTALSTTRGLLYTVHKLSLGFPHPFTPLLDFLRLSPTYYMEERKMRVVGQEYIAMPMQNIISSRIFPVENMSQLQEKTHSLLLFFLLLHCRLFEDKP